jgi:hypothetical protein
MKFNKIIQGKLKAKTKYITQQSMSLAQIIPMWTRLSKNWNIQTMSKMTWWNNNLNICNKDWILRTNQ